MTAQQNISVYAKAIQAQLKTTMGAIPVYANFNRNFQAEPQFVTWQLRNVHQPVYTGQTQSNKGIDTPTFQVSVFANEMAACFANANTIIQALHGYSGQFGGSTGIWVAKIDIRMLYNTYDDQVKLHQIILDCTMDVPC